MKYMSVKKRFGLKVVSMFLLVTFVGQIIQPTAAFALTGGPSQPEITQFQQVSASDMVDLFTGDFGYNIPLFEVPGPNGGYPFNLSYQSAPSMDQEASWVGLGWNINPGSIVRNMRGLPDDFDGQQIKREVDMKPAITAGIGVKVNFELFSADFDKIPETQGGINGTMNIGLNIYYNNYKGYGYNSNIGLGLDFEGKKSTVTGGLNFNFSFDSQDGGIGFNLDASVQHSTRFLSKPGRNTWGLGIGYNSNSGVNMSTSFSRTRQIRAYDRNTNNTKPGAGRRVNVGGGGSSSISFAYPSIHPSIGTEMTGGNFSGMVTVGFDPGNTGTNHVFVGFNAFIDVNEIANKTEYLPAYGYLNYQNKNNQDQALTDFNRDKDAMVKSHSTVNLHTPILTYDYYMVNGQGTGGMFRPFRQEVGYIHEQSRKSGSGGGSLGFNIPGDGKKIGINVGFNYSDTRSGRWDENVNEVSLNHPGGTYPDDTRQFRGKQYDDSNYEGPFFKMNGTTSTIDVTQFNSIGGDDAVRFRIDHNDNVAKKDLVNKYTGYSNPSYSDILTERRPRSQNITPFYNSLLTQGAGVESLNEMRIKAYSGVPVPQGFYNETNQNLTSYESRVDSDRKSHIGGFIVTNPDGNRYVYGLPAYNVKTKEHIYTSVPDDYGVCQTHRELDLDGNGAIRYKFDADDNSTQDDKYDITDQFKSITTTPSYTHSHLLTSILGTDYVDIDNIAGPSDGDYGYWVKFNYIQTTNSEVHYKWRNPYTGANYSAGSEASYEDDKINFTYGEKEIWYLATVETKTHIAVFEMSKRADGKGAGSEINNFNSSGAHIDNSNEGSLYKLDKIKLYAKEEYKTNLTNNTPELAIPIQTIHFEYDYSLCPGVPNNNGQPDNNKNVLGQPIPNGEENGGNINQGIPNPNYNSSNSIGPNNLPQLFGKLTLKAVYFTYKHDHTGKNHKYRFDYASNRNYEYVNNRYDRWGTYNWYTDNGQCANANFPFTPQFPQHPFPNTTNPDLSPVSYNFNPDTGPETYDDDIKRFKDETHSAVAAWCLNKISLPSGGSINVVYESDDYAYVQHREATQMFKITSFGFGEPTNSSNDKNTWLYDQSVPIHELGPDNGLPGGSTGEYDTENCSRLRKVFFRLEKPINDNTPAKDIYKQIYREYIHPLKRDDKYQVYINARVYLRGNIAEDIGSYYTLDINPSTIKTEIDNITGLIEDGADDAPGYECDAGELPFGIYQKTVHTTVDGVEDDYYTHGYIVLDQPVIDNFDADEAAKYHPIAVNAWYYMKQNLSKLFYSIEDIDPADEDYERIIRGGSLLSIFPQMAAMFRGLPAFCYNSNFAWRVDLNQSWIKLASPDQIKYGGGNRVKAIYMQDDSQWAEDNQTDLLGQVYDYTIEEKVYNEVLRENTTKIISSGVAAYEPLIGGEENSLRFAKFYSKTIPMDLKSNNQSYYEGPYNEAFFPAPQVGYRQVTVSSIPTYYLRNMPNSGDPNFDGIKATGITINEFYTSKEYPSLAYETDLFRESYVEAIVPIPFIGTITDKQVVCSQGYVIRLNDMHGKPKKVTSYGVKSNGDLSDIPTSSVEYIYKSKTLQYDGKEVFEPDNNVEVLVDDPNMRGEILAGDNPTDGYQANTTPAVIGMDYEFFYDMRQGSTKAGQGGLDFNLDLMGFGIFVCPVPLPWPSYSQSYAKMNTIVANKIIHKAGILERVIATDGQSRVSTKNVVFDPITGEPLLTVVNNNFDEPVYNYSVPGRFIYDEMSGAYSNSMYEFLVSSNSIDNGIVFNSTDQTITVNGNAIIKNPYTSNLISLATIAQYLQQGDEFIIEPQGTSTETKSRAYLLSTISTPVNCSAAVNELKFFIKHNISSPISPYSNVLPASNGTEYRFSLVRSGNRNLLGNNVGSIISLNTAEISDQPPFLLDPNASSQPSILDIINHSPLRNRMKENLTSTPSSAFAYLNYLVGFLNDRLVSNQLQLGYYPMNDPMFFSGSTHLYPELYEHVDFITIGSSTGNNGTCLDCPDVHVQEIGTVPSGYSITIKIKEEYGGACIYNPCFARKYFIVNAQPINNSVQTSILSFQNISGEGLCKLKTQYFGSASYEAVACSTTVGCMGYADHNEFTTILNTYNPLITSPNYEAQTTSDACFDCVTLPGVDPFIFKIKNILQASAYIPKDVWGNLDPDMYATGKKGIWRPSINFYYKDERYQDVSMTVDLSGDGVFANKGVNDKMFYLFNWIANSEHPLPVNWILNNEIVKYNINGVAVETKDILNIYNATIFDKNTNLPVAIADNTKKEEMMHFNFDNNDLPGTSVVDGYAFTGKKSLSAASTVEVTFDFDSEFKLEANKSYYISAWTGGYNMTKSPKQLDLENPNQMNIKITFSGTSTSVQFKPSGLIYEGTGDTYWRRLEGTFTVPAGATGIKVQFMPRDGSYSSPENIVDDIALFDDIRLHPAKSIMKSFVYDEVDFKLKAELDENNYPMYYGYDASGQLTVVKVLTENGIKTIKEAYSNTKRQ